MALPLVTPTGSSFIKDWPNQNEVTCDLLDAFTGPSLTTHPLQSYTPQLLATTTNPTLGTGGFIRGFYYKIFNQIFTWGEFRFGTASINAGTGIWSITLPFAANTLIGANDTPARGQLLGSGLVWDDSSGSTRQPVITQLRTSTEMEFGTIMGTGNDLVTATTPITWAINDGMFWNARYQGLS